MSSTPAASVDARAVTPSSSDLLAAALEYARASFPVFPVYEMAPNGCACGQAEGAPKHKPGKHPRTHRGFLDATADENQIQAWWSRWPNANLAIATGHALAGGGFLVAVDVDPRNGGEASLARLLDLCPTLTNTRIHTSGGGGLHLLLRSPIALRGVKLDAFPGIDFQGVGQYIIAPPSNHVSGGRYEGEAGPMLEVPEELLGLLLAEQQDAREGFEVESLPVEDGDERIARANTYLETNAPLSIEGQRGRDVFFGVAVSLMRRMLLPIDVAAECVERVYNPRLVKAGTTPWEGGELWERLESARVTSSVSPGDVMTVTKSERAALTNTVQEHTKTLSMRGASERIAALKERTQATRTPRGTQAGEVCPPSLERRSLKRDQVVHALYLSPEWDGVLWYDVLKRRPFAVNPPIDAELSLERGNGLSSADVALIAHWFATRGEDVQKDLVEDAVHVVTAQRDRQKNAIAEYLDTLDPATDSHVLDTLATDVFGATDDFANVLLKKTLVGAARRARTPGYPHKGMLVLKGEQCCGKTPAVKILAGDRYYTTGNGDITSDWTLLSCAGSWLVEVEELSAAKRDVEALKTAISRTHDTPNVKYEKSPQPYPRSFVFIGTTNKPSFLSDPSGDARYWTIEVGKIDLARLTELRDRIWAEADFLARTMPERWNELTPDELATLADRQSVFRKADPFLEPIREWLEREKVQVIDAQLAWDGADLGASKRPLMVPSLGQSITGTKCLPTPSELERIEACFQLLGCAKKTAKDGARPRIENRRPRTWWVAPVQPDAERTSGPEVDQQVVQPKWLS